MKSGLTTLLFTLVLLSTYSCGSRNQMNVATAANEICQCLGKVEDLSPDKFQSCYQTTLDKMTMGVFHPDTISKINTQIVKELGVTCKTAVKGNSGISENADIRMLEEDRASVISIEACQQFSEQKGLYYVETYGDTTRINIEDNVYLETFPDGTYSKLDFKWSEACNFELTFVESNHPMKKDFSKPGEVYQYKVIDHQEAEGLYVLHSYPRDLIFEFIVHY